MDEERRIDEEKYLEIVNNLINQQIIKADIDIEEAPKRYRHRYSGVAGGDEDLIENMVKMFSERKTKLLRVKDSSYFGCIDYCDDSTNKNEKIYIGKIGISDFKGNVHVVDWRAPICSLYYDQEVGKVMYKSPEKHTGEMTLKSQITIKDGKLIDVIDTSMLTKDELILPYLQVSATDKMKDIVASIQQEQNQIIRYPLNRNIIVQGVAGSGKTSVALHRIAYLLYSEKKYKSDRFLVLGPNRFFNDYISKVLPDLDSDGIKELVYSDLLQKYYKNTSSLKVLFNKEDENITNYKNSLDYKRNIDEFLDDYSSKIDLKIRLHDIPILDENRLIIYMDQINGTIKEKLANTMERTIKYIKENSEYLYDEYCKKLRDKYKDLPIIEIRQMEKEAKSLYKNGCRTIVKKEIKKYAKQPIELYKDFINDFDIYCYKLDNQSIKELQDTTKANLMKKSITNSDVCALLYLSLIMSDRPNTDDIVHVVIDEAQDYSLFQFEIIKQFFRNSTFSIFGDLAQSLSQEKSIKNWEEVKEKIFDNKIDILELSQSYRTTKEITEEANKVLERIKLKPARPVLRSGKSVSRINNLAINHVFLDLISKDYNSVALICKNETDAVKRYTSLKKIIPNLHLVKGDDANYYGGMCVIDVLSAKGLEFDAVVIEDESENKYKRNSLTDNKKLYVAMTRALHELVICNGDNEEKIKVKKER